MKVSEPEMEDFICLDNKEHEQGFWTWEEDFISLDDEVHDNGF